MMCVLQKYKKTELKRLYIAQRRLKMKPRKKHLMEWCENHYTTFGYHPKEFEYNGILYEIILPTFELQKIKRVDF